MDKSIAVVGAGVVGLTLALELARRGQLVTLIESRRPGAGTSWGNCGLVEPSHADPLTQATALRAAAHGVLRRNGALRLRLWRVLQRPSWYAQMARHCNEGHRQQARSSRFSALVAAQRAWRRLIAEESLSLGWQDAGLLTLYLRSDSLAAHLEVHRALERLGLAFELWDRARVAQEIPVTDRVAGAIFTPGDSHLDPRRIGSELAAACARRGVTLLTNTQVSAVVRENDAWLLSGETGSWRFEHVAICAGARSRELLRPLGLDIPVEPGKGLSLTWQESVPAIRRPVYFYDDRVAATPWPDGFRLGSLLEFGGFDKRIERDRLTLLTRAPGRYLQGIDLPPLEEAYPWCGLRPMSSTETALVGPVSEDMHGLWLSTGHGQLGVSLAAGSAVELADQMLGSRHAA